MTQAVDSSIAIAAVLADHEAHELAEDALSRSTRTIAHVAIESYSVLTRLPPPLRLGATSAVAILRARLPGAWVALDADEHAEALQSLAAAQVSAGAAYDGLIALTARARGSGSCSPRTAARRAQRAVGARFRLLGDY